MNITNTSSSVSTHDFSLNGEWHVAGTEARWAITYLDAAGERGYSHVIFTLHLKRRYKFYVMNIVLPCVMLSVLILIGFCLPPDAGEKISLGISVLLAFTVFLVMIADSIPRLSSAIPLIGTQHHYHVTLAIKYERRIREEAEQMKMNERQAKSEGMRSVTVLIYKRCKHFDQ